MTQMVNYGLQIAQGISGFMIGSINAKLAATLQKYQNQIIKVQEAMNAQRLTMNEINTQDASTRLNFAIQMQASSDQGSAEVAAAAAGVQGANVNSTMRGLRRSAAFAQAARKESTRQEMQSIAEQRRQNALSSIMAQDITVHQGPSILSAAVGVSMNLLDTYQNSQTQEELAGPSIVSSPAASLGLGSSTANTLLDTDLNSYWKFHTGPNG